MVDTETCPTVCKKNPSCIDMSFLPPIATEKVPSVVRCKCSLGEMSWHSPHHAGWGTLSTSLCCSTLTLRQHTRHSFGGVTSALVSVTWSRAFPGKMKCLSQRSHAELATHAPSRPDPRPGRENALQVGQVMCGCEGGFSSAPWSQSLCGKKEEIRFSLRCFCAGNNHRLEQY